MVTLKVKSFFMKLDLLTPNKKVRWYSGAYRSGNKTNKQKNLSVQKSTGKVLAY